MKTDQKIRQIDALETAFKSLFKQMTELQQQVADLKEENSKLKKAQEENEEEIKNFQNRENISKIVQSMAAFNAGDTAELKWKINEYIREIDRCIAHLKD